MPPDYSKIYSVNIKEHGRRTAAGMATADIESIITFLWGKDSAMYFLVIDEIEYDLECDGDIAEKIRAIVDFHEAFYRC